VINNIKRCKEINWRGNIKYSWKECDVDFLVNLFHINGPEVENMLPNLLNIENRLDIQELRQYLPKISFSTSRNKTACYFFQPQSEKGLDEYRKLFTYLHKIKRGGVFGLNKDQNFFQELYVFPLSKGEEIPYLVNKSEIDINEDLLIGVFLTDKRGIKRKSEDKTGVDKRRKSYDTYYSTTDDDDMTFSDGDEILESQQESQNFQSNSTSVTSFIDTLQLLNSYSSGMTSNNNTLTTTHSFQSMNNLNFPPQTFPYPWNHSLNQNTIITPPNPTNNNLY